MVQKMQRQSALQHVSRNMLLLFGQMSDERGIQIREFMEEEVHPACVFCVHVLFSPEFEAQGFIEVPV